MIPLQFFAIVKQKQAQIVERFGKYHKTLQPGLNFIIPFVDNVAYKHNLKEQSISIDNQTAITKDNVTVKIDGMLFIQVNDPLKASYQIKNPHEAVKLLALTVLRSEIGKMVLDKLFQDRKELNKAINLAVNNASMEWGLTCHRYEILTIDPPNEIKLSMQYEAEAERIKRRDILISEGKKQSEINVALGQKISKIKQAEGEAESVIIKSQKESEGLQLISQTLDASKLSDMVIKYYLSKNYLKNYKKILEKSNLIVAPKDISGKGQSNNEMLTLASMMLLQNRPTKYSQDYDKFYNQQNQPQNYKNQKQNEEIQFEKLENDAAYKNFAKKLEFYDEPSLYSVEQEVEKSFIDQNKNNDQIIGMQKKN